MINDPSHGMIYLIITTSIHNKVGVVHAEHRKNQYIESIQSALKYASLINEDGEKIRPIIVENNGLRKTFMDELGCPVVYTNNNQFHFQNKGMNELLDIKHVIAKYNMQDDDTIIKLTGRYKLLSSSFFELVRDEMQTTDAFVKFFNVCTKKFMFDDCVLGLFALKCKYLKIFMYNGYQSPECEFATFIRNNTRSLALKEVENLDLECCFADDLRKLVV